MGTDSSQKQKSRRLKSRGNVLNLSNSIEMQIKSVSEKHHKGREPV